MTFQPKRFSKKKDTDFAKTLRKRVNEYFASKQVSRHANTQMVVKTVVMILMYFVPFGLILSGVVSPTWLFMGLWVLMGVGLAGIGLSIMHDANHGAYAQNPKLNDFIGLILNLVGGNAINWKIQHNVLHHSYTNIEDADEDIHGPIFLRFSPHQKRLKIHRFQYLYAWFFYGLMTIFWVTGKDFAQMIRYKKMGLTKAFGSFNKLFTELVLWKVFYYIYVLVIPILILPVSPWLIVAGFFVMHFVAGLIMSCIFQPAHVVPDAEYPLPDDKNLVDNNWAVHQLLTTMNFAPNSPAFSWYVGGLNYQIEHHLFPNVCHVHYKKLSAIVKETAKEYGLPYHSQDSFGKAVWQHAKMLYLLGNHDSIR